jgi:hypothetical protein
LLLAALCVAAAAQNAQKDAKPEAQDPAMKAQAGKVVSVDTAKNELAIKDEKGNDKTLRISSATKITKDGKEITLADVKAGDRVLYEYDGAADNPTIKSVVIMSAKTAKP